MARLIDHNTEAGVNLLKSVVFPSKQFAGQPVGRNHLKLVKAGYCQTTGAVIKVVDCGAIFWADDKTLAISDWDFKRLIK